LGFPKGRGDAALRVSVAVSDTCGLKATIRFGDLAPALLCVATVGLVARSAGGWWPTTWGWAAIGLLFVAAAGVILQPALQLGRLDAAFLTGLAALTVLTGLSWVWSESRPLTMLELERTIVYAGGAFALLVVARRRSFAVGLGGLLAAVVVLCGHALATRLVPDQVTWPHSSITFRLAGVFAYANALGIIAVLGLLLALGFAADSERAAVRAAAAASTVPMGLALYFANSRGAWASLAVGLLAAAALAPHRRQLARVAGALLAVGALAIWLASRSIPLTRWTDPLAAAHDGHRLAVAALLLAATAALTTGPRTRWVMLAALATAILAVVVAPSGFRSAALAAGPSPSSGVPGGAPPGTTPTERLFSTTTNSRTEYWRVALIDFGHHPVVGSGAGTFVREWYRHRRIRANVTDAHSLYLETLAELGLVGLLLLLLVLAIPVVAATRVRGRPFVAGALGAYVAFAAHAAVDWDWELPAVTLAGLFCGGLLIVAARAERTVLVLDRRWRAPLLAPVLVLLVFSFVGLVGNRAEASALAAASRGDWPTTAAQSHRAAVWAPWSAQPLVLEADAAAARKHPGAALALLRRGAAKDPADFFIWDRLAAVASGPERQAAQERAKSLNPLG
jgi:hypothetical protein